MRIMRIKQDDYMNTTLAGHPHPPKEPWELIAGILFARMLEDVLEPLNYHVALGGSVLHAGHSENDIDIFLYPHQASCKENKPMVVEQLKKFTDSYEDLSFEYDDKVVSQGYYLNKKVNYFFINETMEPQHEHQDTQGHQEESSSKAAV